MTDSNEELLGGLGKALAREPAYLLVFAVLVVFVVYGGVSAARGENLLVSLVGLGMGLLAAIAVVRIVAVDARAKRDVAREPIERRTVADSDFADALTEIHDNVAEALEVTHPVFRKAVLQKLSRVRRDSAEWSRGDIRSDPKHAEQLTLAVYGSATRVLFATSIPEYRPVWQGALGQRILAAPRGARVTRVFVYGTREEVTDEDLAIMQAQADGHDVDVHLYFDDETNFMFPPRVSKDFIIVDDGVAIGVAVSFGQEVMEEWHFRTKSERDVFVGIRDALLNESIGLAAYLRSLPPG